MSTAAPGFRQVAIALRCFTEGKGGAEEARLGQGVAEVTKTHGAQTGTRLLDSGESWIDGGQFRLHRSRKVGQGCGTNRFQQFLTAREVPIGGVRDDTRAPRRFAQDHRQWPTLAGQFSASLQECPAQVAVTIGPAIRKLG